MASNKLAIATLICCVLLIVEVAWGALQVRDLAREWQTVTQPRRAPVVPTHTTVDVVNAATGTKSTIVTPKVDGETNAQWNARHYAAVLDWKNWVPPPE